MTSSINEGICQTLMVMIMRGRRHVCGCNVCGGEMGSVFVWQVITVRCDTECVHSMLLQEMHKSLTMRTLGFYA